MLLGVFLKVCQAYHSHLRTVTSLPEQQAATERQHRSQKSTTSTATFFRSSRSTTRTDRTEKYPLKTYNCNIQKSRWLELCWLSGTLFLCRLNPSELPEWPQAPNTISDWNHPLPHTADVSQRKALRWCRQDRWHRSSKGKNTQRTKSNQPNKQTNKQTEKMPETHTDKPHIRARVRFFCSVRKSAGLCCRAAFVPVRIKPSCSRGENQWRWMWPDGNLCFYCVYTRWKCADGDCGQSEDLGEQQKALKIKVLVFGSEAAGC